MSQPLPLLEPFFSGVAYFDLREGDCRWPLWNNNRPPIAERYSCGAPALEGKPYCLHHTEKASAPVYRGPR